MKSILSSDVPTDKFLFRLAQAKNQAGRKNFLDRHLAFVRSEVVVRLAQLVVETIRKDTLQALRLSESGLLIARRLRNRECMATALRAKANALYGVGNNRAAVNFHRKAIKIFLAVGGFKEAARALSGMIQPLILLGEYRQAFLASERARKIFLKLGDDWRIARLNINVGNISHRQDRFEEAFHCYERAYEGLLAHHDAEGMGVVLGNMAVCLVSLNDFARALGTYVRKHASSVNRMKCLCLWHRWITTSPTSIICAANTAVPLKDSIPRSAPSKPLGTSIMLASANWIFPRSTWN